MGRQISSIIKEKKLQQHEILTLPAMLEQSARLYPHRTALSYVEGDPVRYFELKTQVDHLSAFLQDQGIGNGNMVAIIGENSPNWGIAFFAITSMGAVAVPILPDFHTSEVHHIIRHSGSKAIFVSERFFQKVEDLNLDEYSSVVLLDDFSIIAADTSKARLKKLLADGSKELKKIKNIVLRIAGLLPAHVNENALASIVYTSGTTGHSKGVMLSHKNLVLNAIATTKIVHVTEEDRLLSILPLAHVYECTLGFILPIMKGAAIYYLRKPPTAAIMVPALASIKPTLMLSVPLIIEKMYKSRIVPEINNKRIIRLIYKFPFMRKRINRMAGRKLLATFGGQLKTFCIGGAGLSSEVEKFLREAEFPYAIGYGLTETSPLVAGTNAQLTRYRSTGPALPGVEIKIDHADPKTGEGEILVRGETVMQGYFHDPDRTADVLTSDGWLKTGDLGYFDADKYLYINGRLKNVIVGASGENIYPEAIESVINRSDIVLESLVYQDQGALSARIHLDYEKLDLEFAEQHLGESQIQDHIAGLLEAIRKQVNDQVSSFSRIGRVIEQTEPFEKTPTQKIKRYLYIN
jgi:long-chain acyl-CoA synthetase